MSREIGRKTLSCRYYLGRLWKITTAVNHAHAGSIYSDERNIFIKLYDRRTAIGQPWELVRYSLMDRYRA